MAQKLVKQSDEMKDVANNIKEINKILKENSGNCLTCQENSDDEALKGLLTLGGIVGAGFLIYKVLKKS